MADYFRHEGIQLDPENIQKNPGLRSLAKLCLNRYLYNLCMIVKDSLFYLLIPSLNVIINIPVSGASLVRGRISGNQTTSMRSKIS